MRQRTEEAGKSISIDNRPIVVRSVINIKSSSFLKTSEWPQKGFYNTHTIILYMRGIYIYYHPDESRRFTVVENKRTAETFSSRHAYTVWSYKVDYVDDVQTEDENWIRNKRRANTSTGPLSIHLLYDLDAPPIIGLN